MLKVILEEILDFVKGGEVFDEDKDENPFKRYLMFSSNFNILLNLQEDNDDNVSKLAKEIIKML